MYLKNTSVFIEKVTSGFLGYEIIYFLWIDNKYCGASLDGKTWKLKFTNVNKNDVIGCSIS